MWSTAGYRGKQSSSVGVWYHFNARGYRAHVTSPAECQYIGAALPGPIPSAYDVPSCALTQGRPPSRAVVISRMLLWCVSYVMTAYSQGGFPLRRENVPRRHEMTLFLQLQFLITLCYGVLLCWQSSTILEPFWPNLSPPTSCIISSFCTLASNLLPTRGRFSYARLSKKRT